MSPARTVLAALLFTPALALAEPREEWDALGHALTLVQTFVRVAAESPDPREQRERIAAILSGRNPSANHAVAGLLEEATGEMPPEHRAQVAAIGRDLMALARRDLAAAPPAMPASTREALQARKDLASIGLVYHDAGQYLDAVRRNDALAVELFLRGRGVNPSARDAEGRSALEIARGGGNAAIADLIARSLPPAR